MKRLTFVLTILAAGGATLAARQQVMRPNLLGVGTAPTPAPITETIGAEAPFFDDNVLQDIGLTISDRDWQTLQDHFLDNDYYQCDFRWRDQVVRNAGIRSRGTGSRSGVKPGLRVDFDRYVTGQTFLGLKSFVLRNNTQDASSMHERLSMLLFRKVGEPAEREAHATLSVNNRYAGLYTIVESVDKKFVQATFGESDPFLYKYDYPVDGTPYFFEDRGSDPASYVPLPFKPETHETDSRPEFFVQLVQAINQTSDANFRSTINNFFDLKKVARHVAVEHFLTDNDGFTSDYGGMNNYYIFRASASSMFTLIPWDKSEAFKGGVGYSIFRNISDGPFARKNPLLSRALAQPDVYSAYLDALVDCANAASATDPSSGSSAGWLEREINREYAQIRDAERADQQKPFTNDQFEAEVANLIAFARQRSAFVLQQVAAAR